MGEKGIVSGVLVAKDSTPPNERIGIFTSLPNFSLPTGCNGAFSPKEIRRNYKHIYMFI